MTQTNYIIATIRPWNFERFKDIDDFCQGNWYLITRPEDFNMEYLESLHPRYIFFPHWSQKVPLEVIEKFECICFHETDLPFGRGGSPVQNLIERGHTETMISALKMVQNFDAGPIYAKRHLSLSGLAEEIFIRASAIILEIIKDIVKNEPKPKPQTGEPTVFKRRQPDQSQIPAGIQTLDHLFDHIRMLDAQEYPRAYIETGNIRIEFSRPALRTGKVESTATITLINNTSKGT